MARLIDQYSAIYKSENWPFLKKEFPNWVQNFAKKQIKRYKIDPDFLNIVKVASFYPIWSHCTADQVICLM